MEYSVKPKRLGERRIIHYPQKRIIGLYVITMKEILKLDHIQKYYGNGGNVTKAIQDISFSVQEGEFVGIMGASGSGDYVKIRLS